MWRGSRNYQQRWRKNKKITELETHCTFHLFQQLLFRNTYILLIISPLSLSLICTYIYTYITYKSLDIYALNLFIAHSGEHWWEQNIFCLFTTSILAKLSTWFFEHSGNISNSLLVNPSHIDDSWEGRSTCLWIYIYIHIYNLFSTQSFMLPIFS